MTVPMGEIDRLGEFVAKRVNLDATTKVYHLPDWKGKGDAARIAALREIAEKGGRDYDIATLAVNIIRDAGVPSRDYRAQAAALLTWVQTQIYYMNEPGERLKDPVVTLKDRYGDCDDMAILLAALYESCKLPWRYVLSGKSPQGKLIRWVEGTSRKRGQWTHIYVIVGYPPYTPKKWLYAEPTLARVPLGWDVVGAARQNGGRVALPELSGPGDAPLTLDSQLPEKGKAPKPFVHHVASEVAAKLHPRTLVPTLIVGLVVAGITASVTGRKKGESNGKRRR
jgi:hypothetical protein